MDGMAAALTRNPAGLVVRQDWCKNEGGYCSSRAGGKNLQVVGMSWGGRKMYGRRGGGVRVIIKGNMEGCSSSSSSSSGGGVAGKKVNGVNRGDLFLEQRSNELVIGGGDGNLVDNEYLLGRFVEDRFVFRQSFVIRSYEIGPDKTATMETLMNLLQETALNHVAMSGLAGDGFGATRQMSIRKLIWVVTRIHVQVQKYSSWGDVVEIDTWVDAAGKNGMRRDWIIREYNTQKVITRATSTWVIMNRETRRLSKMPDDVKSELLPFFFNRRAIVEGEEDTTRDNIDKLTDQTADAIKTGLAPRWSDMDANQHVNNVKYIGWILESVPINILENYYMRSMTLEYRRECRQSNQLQSLTKTKPANIPPDHHQQQQEWECTHLLQMEDNNAEIVRGRSIWQTKINTQRTNPTRPLLIN
ncbi:palmitoyl-acyl carrier protein thioesterase, chloroplastic-like [Andrographis paniculata]|uniref:palmitoyl-acyl carrier protein thioesterase, chloroplastic-like n=1 Tax=Andrographis paniculata TaxID=175694 RepID=UPI0021E9AEC4|nr:palmitoyl-acyl carrier protein thioesterase, chloroplastic-like [Andrographis paniculata]